MAAEDQGEVADRPMGDRLRIFLELRDQSVPKFARETGIPAGTLNHYVAGRRRPGAGHLIRMSAAGLDIGWLLTGKLRVSAPSLLAELDEPDRVVGADRHLLELIEREACKAADAYRERRRARGGEVLTTHETLLVFNYYIQRTVQMAAQMRPMLAVSHLREIGIDTVIDMSSLINSSDLDPAIDKIILEGAGVTDAPNGSRS